MKKLVALAFTVVALVALIDRPAVGQEGYRIIVHADNPSPPLSRSEVSDIFRKKKSRWDNDDRVTPVDQLPDSAVREAFSQDVHRRSTSSIISWWQRQIFSGRDTQPRELASDRAVIDFVSSNRGAIGYVSPSASLNGVKVLVMGG